MTDPFQRLSEAKPDFLKSVADGLEARAQDPAMKRIIDAYLDPLDWDRIKRAVEIGCGTGPITRAIARRSPATVVTGFEPTQALVDDAEDLARDLENVDFECADGRSIPLPSSSVDLVVMHTLLTHVERPADFLDEAFRLLSENGTLVVCDCDFSKATLGGFDHDPLQVCADHFVQHHVTNRFLVGSLRGFVKDAGFSIGHFGTAVRLVTDSAQMADWVEGSVEIMVEKGQISRQLADALKAEYDRRLEEGQLYGQQIFATLIARKP